MSKPRLAPMIGPGGRRLIVGSFALLLLTIALLPRQTQEWLERIGRPITHVVAVPLHALASLDRAIRDLWNHYIALQGVYEQNVALRQEIERLQGEIAHLREHVIVSEQLDELLQYQQDVPVQTVAARIIGWDPASWYRAIVLGKGETHGLRKEMGVITPAGVVGRVVKTTPTTATVLLLTDPNVAVAAMIQRTRDEGIVQGTAQGGLRMKYLPPLSSIEVDDMVVTSGLTGDFPRGLPIGRVVRVTTPQAALFQSVDLSPAVDFSKLEGVLVITSLGPLSDLSASSPSSTLAPSTTTP